MRVKKKLLRRVWFPLLVLGVVAVFVNRGPKAVEPTAAPPWELQDLDGNIVWSADFTGKVVAINFWATWCPPCRVEIPGFVRLQEAYENDGFVIVGISMDDLPPSSVAAFAEEMKINYPVVMGNPTVAAAFGGVRALPATVIIDRDGMIQNIHKGYLTKNAFERAIKPLL